MTALNTTVPFGVTSTDPFASIGITTSWGIDFALISLDHPESQTPVVADDPKGEYVTESAKTIDGKINHSATYKAQENDTLMEDVSISVGAGTAVAVESMTITCNKGEFAQVQVSGHEHVGGSRATHNNTARDVPLPKIAAFGATNFGYELGVPEAAIQSATWQMNAGHTDDQDKDGNFLCGTTHGITLTMTFEAIDPTAWSLTTLEADDWIWTEKGNSESNTTHQSKRLTVVKYIGGPTAAASTSGTSGTSGT